MKNLSTLKFLPLIIFNRPITIVPCILSLLLAVCLVSKGTLTHDGMIIVMAATFGLNIFYMEALQYYFLLAGNLSPTILNIPTSKIRKTWFRILIFQAFIFIIVPVILLLAYSLGIVNPSAMMIMFIPSLGFIVPGLYRQMSFENDFIRYNENMSLGNMQDIYKEVRLILMTRLIDR